MLQFFQSLVAAKIPGLEQKDLLDMLVNPVMAPGANGGERIHKQGRSSIAKCVAALVVTQSSQEAHSVVQSFANTLKVRTITLNQAPWIQLEIRFYIHYIYKRYACILLIEDIRT